MPGSARRGDHHENSCSAASEMIYSITSSARASSIGGTSRPSALAVLRLITSSYLVGACTGKSAGFSPLRIRSTYPAASRYCIAIGDQTPARRVVASVINRGQLVPSDKRDD